jgi:hypothetical protein
MNLRIACIASVIALSLDLPAAAQGPEEAEALAQPRDGETATLDLQTIRKFGENLGRFDVNIVWTDTSLPRPADYAPRRVRYMADCAEGSLTLAAVGLFDLNGQVQKTLVVPPRASDPVKPEKGTPAAKWLQRVCMF